MSELRERVARAILDGEPPRCDCDACACEHRALTDADAAITAVVEALAAEAEVPYPNEDPRLDYTEYGGGHVVNMGALVASWLRGHMGDTEATDE